MQPLCWKDPWSRGLQWKPVKCWCGSKLVSTYQWVYQWVQAVLSLSMSTGNGYRQDAVIKLKGWSNQSRSRCKVAGRGHGDYTGVAFNGHNTNRRCLGNIIAFSGDSRLHKWDYLLPSRVCDLEGKHIQRNLRLGLSFRDLASEKQCHIVCLCIGVPNEAVHDTKLA